jgi:hypothetical protein
MEGMDKKMILFPLAGNTDPTLEESNLPVDPVEESIAT